MGLRRSMVAVLFIGAALAAAATPARTAQAEAIDTASVGSPPDFPTYRMELAPSYDLAQLTLPSFERITRDTSMAKALSLDSLVVTRAMVVDSVTALRAGPDRHRTVHNDSSTLLSTSPTSALHTSNYRQRMDVHLRHRLNSPAFLMYAMSNRHQRVIGQNAFPLYL